MILSAKSFRLLNLTALFFGLAISGLLVHEIGWEINSSARDRNTILTAICAVGILATEVLRLLGARTERRLWRGRLIFLVAPVVALLELFFSEWLRGIGPGGSAVRASGLLLLAIGQLTLVGDMLVRAVRLGNEKRFRKLPPAFLVVGTFVLAILVGFGLLLTPKATVDGIGALDALFISTSAVCVTGLSTVDVPAVFTFTGQAIILGLIQIGGLGVMTLAYFVTLMAGQGIGLRDRALLGEILSESNIHHVGKVVRRIIGVTILCEVIGAVGLYLCWQKDLREDGAIWNALFHSISAFCNAGFSTLSGGLMHPAAATDIPAQMIIMGLIITGGLGFVVAGQLPHIVFKSLRRADKSTRRSPSGLLPRVSTHVRLVLVTTLFLLAGGAVCFIALDPAEGAPAGRVWTALFNSVTARTAGFNISDMASLPAAAVTLMCFLMIIGGSPGGTAGGVRTTTFALSLLELGRLLRGRKEVHYAGRRIPREVLDRCQVTVFLSFLWIAASVVAISAAQPKLAFDDVVFESVSAFATVGLSRGITADLNAFSQIVIMLSMLIGRIGVLTFALTLTGTPRPIHYSYPEARLPLN